MDQSTANKPAVNSPSESEPGVEVFRRAAWTRWVAWALIAAPLVLLVLMLFLDGPIKDRRELVLILTVGLMIWACFGGFGWFLLKDAKAGYVKLTPEGVEIYDKSIMPKFIAFRDIEVVEFAKGGQYGNRSAVNGASVITRTPYGPNLVASIPPNTSRYLWLVDEINRRSAAARSEEPEPREVGK